MDASMRPELILFDLDGTLLDDQKQLSPANRRALDRAAAQGCEIVIATGRLYHGVPRELLDLPYLRYFILMNGAMVYDRMEDKVLYRAELDLTLAEKFFDYAEPLEATVDCYQNGIGWMDRRYYDHLEDYIEDPVVCRMVRSHRKPTEDFRKTVREGGSTVQKAQCYFRDLSLRPVVMDWVARELPGAVCSVSMPTNLEINDARATKGLGLQALCRVLDLELSQTAAFGDGTNDLAMLQCAGIGVAMANGAAEVKEAADVIAPSNGEDGVAYILNQWFA